MTAPPAHRPFMRLIPLLGLALVVFAFFLIVPPESRSNTAWLDLAALCGLLVLDYPVFLLTRFRFRTFDVVIPQLVVIWKLGVIITPLCILMIWAGWMYGVPFAYQLIYQLTLLFSVLVGSAVAVFAADHVETVGAGEVSKALSLEGMKTALVSCDMLMSRLAPDWGQERASLTRLSENARFLSPSMTEVALKLDDEIATGLRDICDTLRGPYGDDLKRTQVRAALENCVRAMSFRQRV